MRSEALAGAASEAEVTVMFDAEQTYLQPAVDALMGLLMRKYNKERAVVHNTHQVCFFQAVGKVFCLFLLHVGVLGARPRVPSTWSPRCTVFFFTQVSHHAVCPPSSS